MLNGATEWAAVLGSGRLFVLVSRSQTGTDFNDDCYNDRAGEKTTASESGACGKPMIERVED